MAHPGLTPRGITYTHDAASKAFDDQMQWIDALDTKAGILMAADGVIASLVMTAESVLTRAHTTVGVTTAACLFFSLVLALLAFSTRRYEVAPDIDRLVQQMQHLDDSALRWIALEGLVNALEVNESKGQQESWLPLPLRDGPSWSDSDFRRLFHILLGLDRSPDGTRT